MVINTIMKTFSDTSQQLCYNNIITKEEIHT